jgi:TonB family protein
VELAEQKNMKVQKIATLKRTMALGALVAASAGAPSGLRAQSVQERRAVRHLVTPVVPELARKLNLTGTVRVEITIGPDGSVKRTRVLGGHPVLAVEAEHAAQKSTFEPGPRETTETIDFKF